MTVSVIDTGSRSDQVLQAGLVIDMEAALKWLDESSYLFEALSRRMRGGTIKATRMEHKFRERRLVPAMVTVTAAADAAATTVAVSNPEYFHRDDAVYSPSTDEMFLMNEDTGGDGTAGSITVINKAGSGGITTAIGSGAVLINLGERHAEGEAIPPAWGSIDETLATYLQQHDKTIQVTDIQNAEEHYGMKEIAKLRKQRWIEYARERNLALYASQQVRETTSAGGPRRHALKGLNEWLDARSVDASQGNGFTMALLGQWIRPTKAHTASSPVKALLGGQNCWVTLSGFADGAIRINPAKDQNWGVTFKELNTPFGDLMCFYDPTLSAEYGMADKAYILDPKYVGQLEMTGLPLRMRLNIGNSTDIHNITDVITGTRGLQVELAEMHVMIENIGS